MIIVLINITAVTGVLVLTMCLALEESK